MSEKASARGGPRSAAAGHGWLLSALLLVAAIVYLATIDRQGFWSDEIRTVGAVELPFAEMVSERLENGHPPVFFAVSRAPASLFGATEVPLRLLPLLLGLVSGGLLFAIGRDVAGAGAGLLAATLLLVSPFQIYISQMARGYTLLQSLLLAAVLFQVRAREDTWRGAAGFSLPATLAMWVHLSALPVVAMLTVASVATRRWRAAVGGLGALMTTMPVLLAVRQVTTVKERLGWIDQQNTGSWLELFGSPFMRFEHPLVVGGIVSVGVLALGALGLWWLHRGRALLAAVWLGPPVVMGIATLAGFPGVHGVGRYFVASWSVGTLLVAVAMIGLWRAWKPAAILVGSLIVGFILLETRTYFLRGTHWPARQVARIVEAERREDEVMVLEVWGKLYITAMDYHYDRPYYRLQPPWGGRVGGVRDERGEPLPADTQGIWLYTRSEAPLEGVSGSIHQRLQRRFPEIRSWPVKRGTLMHMRLRQAGTNEGR